MPSRFLALIVILFLAVHVGTPSFAAVGPGPVVGTAVWLDETVRPGTDLPEPADEEPQPLSAHASPSCHDQCKGIAVWTGGSVKDAGRLSIETHPSQAPPAFVSILVPPPQ
ncbi:hypothetical protein [Neoaquamicrobium sediminum]|uniref:DUF2946 family protein n=1 Tax=Neoaquamicrobium sediminum TaxID=1849104 RepID=A0ABV3WYY4_9HYPH